MSRENMLQSLLSHLLLFKGITFDEFHDFCTFLNNLDDFAIAMRMYSLADRPISESNKTTHRKYHFAF